FDSASTSFAGVRTVISTHLSFDFGMSCLRRLSYHPFADISSNLNFRGLHDNCRPLLFYFLKRMEQMKFYPVSLDISNEKCVVVGGGDVAERKVIRLLECGARVIVVGKTMTTGLCVMKDDNAIEHVPDDYSEECIEDAFLVIGATDRDDVNEQIYRDSRDRGILVNIVDEPARCSFILPAIFRRKDLIIAISTGGKSPALARKLREKMGEKYGPEYGILLDIMGNLRRKIIARGGTSMENKRIFESVLDSDILRYIRKEEWDKAREIIRDRAGEKMELWDLVKEGVEDSRIQRVK
ncbi:MAG: bifunctional precorrin-2 dehydrogenase/sirohydrochlorin ferrochelatase, partial [Thermodesulfobacteriota bacterium]|nr:bifunctional precorrin-2 dehydrogenase/sirohydrochlorin ferrochelatase [Thermodesulfobacteriota bacterium]